MFLKRTIEMVEDVLGDEERYCSFDAASVCVEGRILIDLSKGRSELEERVRVLDEFIESLKRVLANYSIYVRKDVDIECVNEQPDAFIFRRFLLNSMDSICSEWEENLLEAGGFAKKDKIFVNVPSVVHLLRDGRVVQEEVPWMKKFKQIKKTQGDEKALFFYLESLKEWIENDVVRKKSLSRNKGLLAGT